MPDEIPVSPDFQPAPGVDYGDTPAEQPQEPSPAPEKAPEQPVEAPREPEKPAEAPAEEPAADPQLEAPRDPEGRFAKKPKPIASLLEKKHELETQLEAERQARQELEAKLASQASQPAGQQSDADIKALAEEYGLDEELVTKLVNTARKGISPELPKEVQELLAERQAEKAQAEELKAFDNRLTSLSKTFKDEPLTDPKVREKLLELAYSTEKAPDGEPYYKKELSELYFAFIKPEVEPGKPSAEPSRGGSQATEIVDFEEIYTRDDPKDIEAMDSATFEKYNKWVREHKESKTPLKRS